jgi:hypothetical protein
LRLGLRVAVRGIAVALMVILLPAPSLLGGTGAGRAGAAVDGSDGPGGSISVGASTGASGGGTSASGSGGPVGVAESGGSTSAWTCTSTPLVLNDGPGFAPGGPTPGGWYTVTCVNGLTGAITTETEWIADGSPAAAPAAPVVNPYELALQAENSLELPRPSPRFNPAGTAVVNLPTWLWVAPGLWHAYAVSASAGSVTATATATPVSVTWSMGDGGVVTCAGPGTPFDVAEPSVLQNSSCSYTYRVSSAGEAATSGDLEDASFPVVVTVTWSVAWTAVGAVGGGKLPSLTTSATTNLRVEQVESVNTEAVIKTVHGSVTRLAWA